VRQAEVPPPLGRAVRDLLLGVDEDSAGARLDALDDAVRALADAVAASRKELATLAARRQVEVPFGEGWWARLREGGDDAAWVRAYVEALLAGRADAALLLASPGAQPPAPRELATAALTGAEHLVRDELTGAAGVLRALLDGPWAGAVDPDDRVELEILLARAVPGAPPDRLRAAAAELREEEPELQSRLLAAIGERALAAGDLEEADAAYREALGLADDEVEGLAGAGMLAERREDWAAAEHWFDRAAEVADGVERLERLHAPVPGNLYWRLARHLASQPARAEDALLALDKAIEHGMHGAEPYQERRAYVDKAYLVEHLHRPEDAAAAFADGALRYVWSEDLQTAHGLLERAVELAPDHPEHRWLLAEVLRLLAQRPDGSADQTLIGQALAHWRAGRRTRPPLPEEAWAYTTFALAAYDDVAGTPSERHRLWTTAAAAEQALVLDPSLTGGWPLLAMAYLDLALPHAALEVAQRAVESYPVDPAAGSYHYQALLALGRTDEALAVTAASEEPWAAPGAAFVHVARREPERALALLGAEEGREPTDGARLIRALALVQLGRDEEAAAEVAAWPPPRDPDSASTLHTAGWVTYLRGTLDRAEEYFARALEDDPAEAAAVLLDRGQVLLARGGPGDLEEGQRLVTEGARRCTRWERFAILLSTELPLLQRRVAGAGHERAVTAVAEQLRGQVAARMDELTALPALPTGEGSVGHAPADVPAAARQELTGVLAVAPADSAPAHAAHAALARLLLAEEPEAALDHYRAAAEAGSGAAWEGVVSACLRARDRADGAPHGPGTHRTYVRLAAELAAVPADAPSAEAARPLRAGLLVRAGTGALLADDARPAAELLAQVQPSDLPPDELAAAVAAVVRDGASYWALTDALERHADAAGAWAPALAAATSLDAVHRTRRADVDTSKVFPLESPVYVHLGPALVPEDTGPDWVLFRELIPQLRDRVRASTGVTIPGIRFAHGALGPTEFEIRLGHRAVRTGTAPAAVGSARDAGPLHAVMAELEDVLRQCLERLFGPDDLTLWVADVDPTGEVERTPDVAALLADRDGRVWTHRVLRLLVREGVPLDDGARLLHDVARATAESGGDVLSAASRVRAARADRLPGAGGAVPLPAELEGALAAGLQEGGASAVWQLPWERAAALVRTVREWQGSDRHTVSVSDPRVRNYLWRLLAPGGRWTAVVTAAEAQAARREEVL